MRWHVLAMLLSIATLATGMPFGICTIDSNASSPPNGVTLIGTPITGSGVSEAAMPGRCAAPPAPAMITCKRLASALLA